MISIDWNPSRQTLRTFAIGLCVLAIAYGTWLAWGQRLVGVRAWLCLVAGGLGLMGVAAPQALRWVYVAWMVLVFPIGWVVFQASLAVLYFGVFTPIGWLMRLLGRDPLQLRTDPNATSYWIPHRISDDPRKHFRQY
jgi:hypothetical protein